ncbi:MAG: hypothetical protein HJJLKODD_01854 [Phycisphaerae bacterium]|nr:hypothetical protein [Phycisphaerae bacterium]
MMPLTLIVARHEFISTVRRKSYYLVTLGMPVILAVYTGFVTLIAWSAAGHELQQLGKPIGLVDHSGVLAGAGGLLADVADGGVYEYQQMLSEDLEKLQGLGTIELNMPKVRLQRFAVLENAQTRLRTSELYSIIELPPDFLSSGQVRKYTNRVSLLDTAERYHFLQQLIRQSALQQSQVSLELVERLDQRPVWQEYELNSTGQYVEVNLLSKTMSLVMPLGVTGLLMIALMMNASLLLASVSEEKENKVIEVILSSVRADQLLFGKVLGLVAAGLLQISVWMMMIAFVPMVVSLSLQQSFDLQMNIAQLLLGGLFVVLGFVFYGSLLTGLGSLGSTFRDSQQLSVIVILFPAVPLMALISFIQNPDGPLAVTLSMIPLFAPSAMMLRLALTEVPAWQVGLSLVLLLISIYYGVKFSARLFRTGTLLYGKRPSIVMIWRTITARE